jgi:AraC-like DNA-binding protein
MANYFETQPDASWGERAIGDLELILIVAGRFSYIERGREPVYVERGHVLCLRPGIRHVFRREDNLRRGAISCIHFEMLKSGSWLAGDYQPDPIPPLVTSVKGDTAIHDLFHRCAQVFDGSDRYRRELLDTMVREIWLRLAEHWEGKRRRAVSPRVMKMQRFLRERLAEPVSRIALAGEFLLTPEYVNSLFKKELGMTPTQFVHRERIARACRMLSQDGLSVRETAARLGFSDPFHFSKVFKKIMGFPPRECR